MGIRFSYFSMVVMWQSLGAYSLISNAEKPIAVPTSRMLFGFVNLSKNFNRLCMDLRMIGTCVSSAYFSISFSHAGFPLSRESINADILSSMIILSSFHIMMSGAPLPLILTDCSVLNMCHWHIAPYCTTVSCCVSPVTALPLSIVSTLSSAGFSVCPAMTSIISSAVMAVLSS